MEADRERTQKETIVVPQPSFVEEYYDTCAIVDQHNRSRQDSLRLEKKVEVKECSKCFTLGILDVCIVDAYMLYKGGRVAKFAMIRTISISYFSKNSLVMTWVVSSEKEVLSVVW